jgi:CBS domain-containing protein
MMTVQEMIAKKGKHVFTIPHDKTVFEAVAEMDSKNVGALIVTHFDGKQDKICGIISERDYLRHIILKGRSSRQTPIHEIMTRKVVYGEPDCTAEQALNIMTQQRFRHLPILDNEELAGIVSIGDCVKAVIKQQQVELNYLKEYIADSYPGPPNHD